MILRYYADSDVREWHDHTLRLFRTLYDDTHGIAVEIDRIDEQHGPAGRTSQAKYDTRRPKRSTSAILNATVL